jgi:hypothetical protein
MPNAEAIVRETGGFAGSRECAAGVAPPPKLS